MADTYESKLVQTPLNKITVVDKKHYLAKDFWTPRNEYKPDPIMAKQIAEAGRPEHPVLLYPVRDEAGKLTELIAVDGNQRVKAALEAGLTTIPSEIRWDWTLADAIKASAKLNATRKENDFATKMLLAHRLVNPTDTGKPQGMSYEEAGDNLNVSHTVVRSLVRMHLFFPKVVKQAIQTGKLSFTVANQELCRAELLKDQEALLKRFNELMSGGGVDDEKTGVPSAKAPSQRAAKLADGEAALTKNQWRLIAQKPDCPEEMSVLIQVFIGDKTLAFGQRNGLDFLEVPKVEKATKKSKKTKKDKSEKSVVVPSVQEIEEDLFG